MFSVIINGDAKRALQKYFCDNISKRHDHLHVKTICLSVCDNRIIPILNTIFPDVLSNIIIQYTLLSIIFEYKGEGNFGYPKFALKFFVKSDWMEFVMDVQDDKYYLCSSGITTSVVTESFYLNVEQVMYTQNSYSSNYIDVFNYYMYHQYGLTNYINQKPEDSMSYLGFGEYRKRHGDWYCDYKIEDDQVFTDIIVVIKMLLDMIRFS